MAQSPNETVRIGIGLGGRGTSHVQAWSRMPNVEIAGICDIDESHIGEKFESLIESRAKHHRPEAHIDIRKVLESKDIDAVSIATPNHWHALADRLGLPGGQGRLRREAVLSHNVFEGRQMVEAARKYNRIVQRARRAGAHRRCATRSQYLRTGKLGKVDLARASATRARHRSATRRSSPPAGVDYDLWLGPAPLNARSTHNRFHYNWHWFWDTGNGDLGNQGIHEMDSAAGASA